jgi:hypothetical protein
LIDEFMKFNWRTPPERDYSSSSSSSLFLCFKSIWFYFYVCVF